ncbi:54S ribosomal protein L38 [Penicillium macrosclerotiorum]|uniref:54S ribosomal protein L38 n=1 Tax=Penicillium macrosclerotiorum TaxID=303699 RepID=UPI002548D511|nr:54S ribosomal protein L38 [Penicillium macrosclerotiorum]KAJ5668985.1 54S ribosomal protein L38 [Penicillium macrosclerotiorum]
MRLVRYHSLNAPTMIQLKTLLNCIDNSGASVVECVNVLKKKRPATIGDRIVVVVQKQRAAGSSEGSSATALANKVRRGDIRHAVVVRVKKELQREDGTVVRFGDNACVLVNKAGDPIGTRMNGQSPIARLNVELLSLFAPG